MHKKDQPEKKRSLTDRKPVSKNSGGPSEKKVYQSDKRDIPRGGDYKHREEKGDFRHHGEGHKGFKGRGDDRRSGGFEKRGDDSRGGFKGRGDDRRSGGFEKRGDDSRGGFKGRGDDRRSGGFEKRGDDSRGGFKGRGDDRRSGGFEKRGDDSRGGFKGRGDDRRSGGFEKRGDDSRGGFKGRGDDRRSGGFEKRGDDSRGGFKGRGDDRRSGGFEKRGDDSRGGFKGRGDDRRSGGFEKRGDDSRGGFKGRGDDRRSGGFEKRGDDSRGGFKGRGVDRRRSNNSGDFSREKRNQEEQISPKEKKFDKRNPWSEDEPIQIPKAKKRERIETKETQSRFGYKGSNKELQKAGDGLRKGSELLGTEVRLNRYIANSGLGSRRDADAMILQGKVTVNGEIVTELGVKVGPKDKVKVDGERVMPEKPVYILLNKPKGYITTTDDPDDRRTVMDLIDLPGKERIYPVGRLDRNTTGVLLLTNDGELSQKLTHPSFEIKKIYRAKLHKKPSKEHMLAWVDGIELEDGYMAFTQIGFVDQNDPSILGLEIHSGRNRIVRRMFEHFGYEVEALDRVLMGEFDKIKLGRGKWRFLTEKEVNYVERIKRTKPKPFNPEDLKPMKSEDFEDLDWE